MGVGKGGSWGDMGLQGGLEGAVTGTELGGSWRETWEGLGGLGLNIRVVKQWVKTVSGTFLPPSQPFKIPVLEVGVGWTLVVQIVLG